MQETPPPATETGDLFHNYEIKTWDLGPRIYKIVAVSAIFNILFVVVAAQTDLLTTKGCDSPFIGRVCQVLDTVYVGALLLGTERDYIDVEYDRIDLGDAEITMIDVSSSGPPLSYPEGYFQIANPEQFAALQAGQDPTMGFDIPGIPSNPGTDLMNTQPVLPSPNRNAVRGRVPDSPFSIEGDDEETAEDTNGKGLRKGRGGRISNSGSETGGGDEVAKGNTNANSANPTVDPTNPAAGVDINKRPMIDLANHVNELRDQNAVDLESGFMVRASGSLEKDGRLNPNTFRFMESSGDPKLVEVVEEAIQAINVAGYLQYLKDLSGEDLKLLFEQDAEEISALIESEMSSEMRAKSIKTLLDIYIDQAKKRKTKPDADQNDKDDLTLLEGATIETDGRKLIIRFVVPKAVAHPMIQRKLAEQAAEAKKPNGNAGLRNDNNSAVK